MAAAVKPSIKARAFITDGARLYQVRRVLADGVTVEDASSPADAPDIQSIGWDEIAKSFRAIEPAPLSPGESRRLEELLG